MCRCVVVGCKLIIWNGKGFFQVRKRNEDKRLITSYLLQSGICVPKTIPFPKQSTTFNKNISIISKNNAPLKAAFRLLETLAKVSTLANSPKTSSKFLEFSR